MPFAPCPDRVRPASIKAVNQVENLFGRPVSASRGMLQTVLFRYLEYVYSFTPVFPENKMPYPTWKRIFSMAHGSFWAIIISVAADFG
ncbi:hypothetical protein [Devosia sp.]|uniref:hypothetical protein n=1 Tax=Devosia sp. TaxID=1871048 RepID=UPI0035B005FA